MGEAKPNAFPSGTKHGPDWYWRVNRAHMNTVENLPVFAVLVVAAVLLEIDVTALAWGVFAARVAQTFFHVASGRSMAVNLRFTAFSAQIVLFAVIAYQVLQAAL